MRNLVDWDMLSAERRRKRRAEARAAAEIVGEAGKGIAAMAEGNGLEVGVAAAPAGAPAVPEEIQAKPWTPEQTINAVLLLERRIVQLERIDMQARATAQMQQSFQQRAVALDLAIKAAGAAATPLELDAMATGLLAWLRG